MPVRGQAAPQYSVIIPVHNESSVLSQLYQSLHEVMQRLGEPYEVLFVNDGSTDSTPQILAALAAQDATVNVLTLRRNFGQTAALTAGVDHAHGQILITMDADLQNDPHDIPTLLAKLAEGFDLVSGWRRHRQDPWLTRRLPSLIANKLISRVTGVPLHDYGCTLKAYRREILQSVHLYGEMHRFIPVYVEWSGGKIAEVMVSHHPRRCGTSHYGLGRTIKVLLDLFTVRFLLGYSTRPIHLFGIGGFVLMSLGCVCGAVVLFQRMYFGVWVHRNPLLLLAVFVFLIGWQLVLMGLLAELIIRAYYEGLRKPTYQLAAGERGREGKTPEGRKP